MSTLSKPQGRGALDRGDMGLPSEGFAGLAQWESQPRWVSAGGPWNQAGTRQGAPAQRWEGCVCDWRCSSDLQAAPYRCHQSRG